MDAFRQPSPARIQPAGIDSGVVRAKNIQYLLFIVIQRAEKEVEDRTAAKIGYILGKKPYRKLIEVLPLHHLQKELRNFGTTTRELLEAADWLTAGGSAPTAELPEAEHRRSHQEEQVTFMTDNKNRKKAWIMKEIVPDGKANDGEQGTVSTDQQ